MLNGRVYGRRRPYNKASTDPFANVRETEPEFVEWGYGGMGSNKSNVNSSMGSAWRAVQNRSNASAFGNDEDDASGMAWVKKRRAARERAKLEAEQTEPQPEDADVENTEPAIVEEEAQDTPRLPKEGEILLPPVETPTVAPTEQPREKPEHITTAITLPPQRAHKRDPSSHRTQTPQVESPMKEDPPFSVDVFDMELSEGPEVTPEVSEPSADSTSEDEDEESSIEEDDEDDSDAYSEVRVQVFRCIFAQQTGKFVQENAHSKTTLGAGVEKVSRHKDVPQSKTPNLPHSPLKNQLPTTAVGA